jgi:hypothetical protein
VTAPALEIAVDAVEPVPHAAAPTLRFLLHADDASGREVYTVALSAQIHIEPARRRYDGADHARMGDLFGTPDRWPATTHGFMWAKVDRLVPSFSGRGTFDIPVPCTYDHEVAGVKYLASLDDGEVPLHFHFSGTVLYRGVEDRLQMTQVPWTSSARFGLPVAVWQEMIDGHFPGGGWLRLHRDTLAELRARAAERGLPSMEAAVLDLLGSPGPVS